jgi:hypothetical protein
VQSGVQLGNLEEFSLAVFNRLWLSIRKLYSTCRKMPPLNKFRIEQTGQQSLIYSYNQSLVLNHSGSQVQTLSKLADFSDFLLDALSPVVLVCGGHGSGKSSLLAKLVFDMDIVAKDCVAPMNQFDSATPHRLLRTKLLQRLEDLGGSLDAQEAGIGSNGRGWALSGLDSDNRKLNSPVVNDDSASRLMGLPKPTSGAGAYASQINMQLEQLMMLDLLSPSWQLRLEVPRVIYFFKTPAHDTLDLVKYLCSALRRKQDTSLATWHRVEELIREVVTLKSGSHRSGVRHSPLLLILDGLNEMERDHMCRITVSFRGTVRLLMTVDSQKIGQSAKGKGKGWQWNDCNLLWNGPLHIDERKVMLSAMIDRLGPKKIPAMLDTFILRPCCGDPIYLATVCAYFRACVDLCVPPVSLPKMCYSAIDILVEQMFPTVESLVGRNAAMWYLEVVSNATSGILKKEVESIFAKCKIEIDEDSLKVLTIAFRPFSDPGQTYSTEKICLNRPHIKQAIFERYHSRLPLSSVNQSETKSEKNQKGMFFGRSVSLTSIQGVMSDKDTDEGDDNWLSDDDSSVGGVVESIDGTSVDGKALATPGTVNHHDEFECWFGSVMLMCNKALFEKFCSTGSLTSTGEFHRRSKTMDLNELLHLLRFTCIFPKHLSKMEVVKAFQKANKNAQKLWVYDITDQNTLADSDHGTML